MSYFLQILWHGFRVLTFRHRGAGLDVSKSCLVVLWMLVCSTDYVILSMSLTEPFDWADVLVFNALVVAATAWFSGRDLAAGLACTMIVLDLLKIAMYSAGQDWATTGLGLIGMAAIIVFALRRAADKVRKES